jgi:hypothetical protein
MNPVRSIHISAILILTLLLVSACEKEGEFDKLLIQDELQPYFDRFTEEGLLRNVTIDFEINPITAELTEIETENIAGRCYHLATQPNHIQIDLNTWLRSSELQREYFVFHELGHCYLQREHLEDVNPNGNCLSIMASGTGVCTPNYRLETRDYYLDELFHID